MREWDLNPRSGVYETPEDDQTPLSRVEAHNSAFSIFKDLPWEGVIAVPPPSARPILAPKSLQDQT